MTVSEAIDAVLFPYADLVEPALDAALPPAEGPLARLHEAMRYSVMGGGKRVRPAFCLAACEAVGGAPEAAVPAAVALELVHTYSLIHDDLPCMDDDDLRRGRPTSHRVYGEALAVLAGDALLTRAFGALAESNVEEGRRLRQIAVLAEAAGSIGMVGGQALDLAAEGSEDVDLPTLQYIHTHKTGALFAASCRMGALAGGAEARDVERLGRFGAHVGLAFQIADDLLDETAEAGHLGKASQKDRVRGKATYPRLLGLKESRSRMEELDRKAEEIVGGYGTRAEKLARLARFVVRRTK
jgi:geranylgeranyl diphosphate synthase type II